MPPADETRAAELLEKLLTDGEFRASFRRNPANACAEFDLADLAREFGAGSEHGKSLHTLEIRESRSSLAGALMAAASEGGHGMESLRKLHESHALPGDAHRVVHTALTGSKLQAVDPSHHLAGSGAGVHDLVDTAGSGSGASAGTGGAIHEATAHSVSAVLDNSQLTLSPEAHAALVRGGADQRLVDVLESLSHDHQLRIGTLHVTHGAGGDSLDILSVDGQRVSQSNIAARDLANELASLAPGQRPTHIVTPWPISGDGFSTHGGHDDRIHIVFGPPPDESGGAQSASLEPAGTAPATVPASEASVSTDTTGGTAPDTSTPSTPTTPSPPSTPTDSGTPPAASGSAPADTATPPADPTTPPADPTPADPTAASPSTPPADPGTPPASPGTTPVDPSTQPVGNATPTDGAPATDPDTPPADPTTPPATSGTAPTDAPVATTPPPPPVDQHPGGTTSPPDSAPPADPATPPADSSTPQAGGHAAESGTPPDTGTTPDPGTTPADPPATSTPPAGTATTPAAPPPVTPTTPPPSPTTPPVAPSTPPPTGGTVPEVTHQSVQLEAVGGAPPGHSTVQIELPQPNGGAGDASRQLLDATGGATGFDPNVAGALPDASDTYPGDNAGQAAIAAWMARQAHAAGLPAELPIMAALTESGLKNDNYGDRDSLGFFQMRTSIWDQGEYKGFSDHPELQLKWFINQALAVRSKEVSEGNTSFGSDRSKWGDWVADVEQPAAEYRGRYQTHLDQADSLIGAGSSTAPAALPGGATNTDPSQFAEALQTGAGRTGYSPAALQALTIAQKYTGTPYHWGGDTPETGFDCSGLVEYSYAQVGIHIPRVAADQFNVGIPVSKEDLKPGDIVFFKDSTGYVHHEGIYIGNDMFLHAPHTGDVVKISSLDDTYYAQQFAGGRDVSGLGGGGSPVVAGAPPEGVAPSPPVPGTPPPTSGSPPSADPQPATGSQSGLFGSVGSGETPGDGTPGATEQDGLTGGLGNAPPKRGSTVQMFPAIKDPADTSN